MSSKRTSLEGAQLPVASLSRAGSASIPELAHASTLDYCVVKTIVELEGFGVTVAEGDKVAGGVLLTPMYIQHALFSEGKAEVSPEIMQAKVVLAKLEGPEPTYVPVTEAQLADDSALAHMPKFLSVFARAMSPAAVSQMGWQRVPAVALVGAVPFNPEALAVAEAQGLAVSPSMDGPYAEETTTVLNVFLKSHKFPMSRVFILRDWGFAVFAGSMEEATALFDASVRPCLTVSTGMDSQAVATPTRMSILANALKRLGTFSFRTSEQAESGAAMNMPGLSISPLNVMDRSSAGGLPEPGSPGAAGGLSRAQVGSPPSNFSIPEDIRKCPSTSNNSRRTSQDGRIPSFVTGMRPW